MSTQRRESDIRVTNPVRSSVDWNGMTRGFRRSRQGFPVACPASLWADVTQSSHPRRRLVIASDYGAGMNRVSATTAEMTNGRSLLGDLRDRCGDRGLTELVLSVVTEVSSRDPGQLGGRRPWGLNGRVLLTVVTYCYAAGIYDSEQIEEAVRVDPQLRYLRAQESLSEAAVRSFRRAHCLLLRECLAGVLWAAELAAHDGGSRTPALLESPGIDGIPAAYLAAARRRLDLAILIDTARRD